MEELDFQGKGRRIPGKKREEAALSTALHREKARCSSHRHPHTM